MPARDFSAVYDEHVWQVYGFFAYRMRNRADAEDLTQQTFERALKAWSRYDPVAGERRDVAASSIARNLLVDHLRADRSARQQPLDELDSRRTTRSSIASSAGPRAGARARAGAGEPRTAREREIIALRFGGELSGPEIAEATGLTSPTCSRSSRARCAACELGDRRRARSRCGRQSSTATPCQASAAPAA